MKKSRTARPLAAVESPAVRTLPLVELLVDTKTELFELMVRSGLRVLDAMLEEDRTALCGPRYAHQPARVASRAGTVSSEVVLGGRKVVTANNPVTRFLLEMSANPAAQSDFTAALADLGAVKKGEERLASHLQSPYLTTCEKCEKQIHAQSFLWRKGEHTPYAKIYECPHCGDSGEHPVIEEDLERAKRIAETDTLHRSRAFEKVASLHDEDRFYAEEAISHYLPRPLYVLTTVINRLDSLNLPTERKRALTALILLACDAGNTLWAHPAERPRPKQLSTPNQFREDNLWIMLERGIGLFAQSGSSVPVEAGQPELVRIKIMEPLALIPDKASKVDIDVSVAGGVIMGQAEATRTAIAKAIVDYYEDEELARAFKH